MSTTPKRNTKDGPWEVFWQIVCMGLWVFAIWAISLVIWPHQ